MRRRLVATLALALLALAAQTWFKERSATAALPAPGDFVDVEGIRLPPCAAAPAKRSC